MVATAYFARSAELTARAARTLGDERAERYAALARDIRAAFVSRFVSAGGRVEGDTQTGHLLALAFELLPGDLSDLAAERLAALVEEAGPGLSTGFLGVGLIAPVLDRIGRSDLVHALLRRTSRPSWLYPLRHGATTIWERWDGYTEDGGFQAAAMNSFNHYALGSVGEWLYRGVAGLDQAPGSVGYRELVVRPRPLEVPPGGRAWAEASHESVRGRIAVRWEREDDAFRLDVTVPPGSTATVHIPVAGTWAVSEGGDPIGESPGIEVVGADVWIPAGVVVGLGVSARSRNADAAKAFIEFLGKPENINRWAEAVACIPLKRDASSKIDPVLESFLPLIDANKAVPFMDQGWPNAEVQPTHFAVVQELLAGKTTVEKGLGKMDEIYRKKP